MCLLNSCDILTVIVASAERGPSKVERYRKPVGFGAMVTGLLVGGATGAAIAIIGAGALLYPGKKDKKH